MSYVGQTTWDPPEKRWNQHKANARIAIKYRNGDPTVDDTKPEVRTILSSRLYGAMAEHGIDDFEFTRLEKVDDVEELNAAEKHYVDWHDTREFGYNMTTGGGSKFKHHQASIDLMVARKLETLDSNRHPVLAGMPPCVTFNERTQSISVAQHDLCPSKLFSLAKYKTVEAEVIACTAFLRDLEAAGVPYVKTKRDEDLKPYPGINRYLKNGFQLTKQIKKVKYTKTFNDPDLTREQNKQQAIDYYNATIVPLLPPK